MGVACADSFTVEDGFSSLVRIFSGLGLGFIDSGELILVLILVVLLLFVLLVPLLGLGLIIYLGVKRIFGG